MSRKGKLALAWVILYVVCTIFGFINTKNGFLQAIFALVSIGFFLPGGILLYEAIGEKNKTTILTIRYLSIASLCLTVLTLIGNVLTLPASEAVGDRMYALLVLVSTPMISSQMWVISLFLWACLLMGSFIKKTKRSK